MKLGSVHPVFGNVVRVCSDSRVPRGRGNAIGRGQVGQLVLGAGQHWLSAASLSPTSPYQNKTSSPFHPKETHTHTVKHPGSYFCSTEGNGTRNACESSCDHQAVLKSFICSIFSHQKTFFYPNSGCNAALVIWTSYYGRISPLNEASVALPLCILFTVPPGVLHSSTRLHRSYFLPLCTFSSFAPSSE